MKHEIVSKLFLDRSRFVVLGLTGRTGSGCTTAAKILNEESPAFPYYDAVNIDGCHFYEGLDVKRYNIARNYLREGYERFSCLKVSDLITAYILSKDVETILKFVERECGVIGSGEDLNNIISEAYASKNDEFDYVLSSIIFHDNDLESFGFSKEIFYKATALVKEQSELIRNGLNSLGSGVYTKVYQAAGNSIRRTGEVKVGYNGLDFSPEKIFHLPESINRTIKIIRKFNGDNSTLIVIDAIRNPYEAKFFKDRYSAFYLFSINAPDEVREDYMLKVKKYSLDNLIALDSMESGKNTKTKKKESDTKGLEDEFVMPNVKRCIEMSDVHIFNPRKESHDNVLRAQLIWYVALIKHPGLFTPTAMERVMQLAYTAKSNSGCISRQVGAVVTDSDNSIKSIGWNDVPKGQVPCSLRSLSGLKDASDSIAYSEYERNDGKFREKADEERLIYKDSNSLGGRNISYCFKDVHNSIAKDKNQVHTRSLHAEENAFLQIAKYGGMGVAGGKLYTTASPCELCAKKAYHLGISEIVFIDPYPGIAKSHILKIGHSAPKLTQFKGAVGRGYHQLYDPLMSYKDELKYFKG